MKVLLLDGHYPHTVSIAAELKRVLNADIIGVAVGEFSHLARSAYAAAVVVSPAGEGAAYGECIEAAIKEFLPDVVVPVGYESFRLLVAGDVQVPSGVGLIGPTRAAFERAASKELTYAAADAIEVRRPRELGRVVGGVVRCNATEFPIFAKSVMERGGVSTAIVQSEADLAAFEWSSLGDDVVLQEYIDSDAFTYGFNGYFVDGEPLVSSMHVELRSVPRRGGSATRIRSFHDPDLEASACRLMKSLEWTGVAQVEFKRASDGGWILMEINPKFWASYAHTSFSGACIASVAVQRAWSATGLSVRQEIGRQVEMVFPIREMSFALRSHSVREVLTSIVALVIRPARIDFPLSDILAHVPSGIAERLARFRSFLDSVPGWKRLRR